MAGHASAEQTLGLRGVYMTRISQYVRAGTEITAALTVPNLRRPSGARFRAPKPVFVRAVTCEKPKKEDEEAMTRVGGDLRKERTRVFSFHRLEDQRSKVRSNSIGSRKA